MTGRCRVILLGTLLSVLCSVVLFAEHALAIKILSPGENNTLKAGDTITAKVDLGKDTGVEKVRFFWYTEHGDTLVEQEESDASGTAPESKIADEKYWQKGSASTLWGTGASVVAVAALVSTPENDPPFGGQLLVPKEAIGTTRLLAVGKYPRGPLEDLAAFDEILVRVEPEAELTSIEFETEKPLRLGRGGQTAAYDKVNALGQIIELPVVGVFADGVVRSIRPSSTGSTYASSDETVMKVLPDGMFRMVGNGRATITVTNRGRQSSLDVEVELQDEPNQPPIADAGKNRTVRGGKRVVLNGLNSRDPEGGALFYTWSQVRGSKVALLDPNMPKASFLAPDLFESRLFRFKLQVTEGGYAREGFVKGGADSLPVYVDIVVEP
ncbi:MAG: hypothetical protein ACE5NA_02135 [Nitrospiraceae bacterium]